jgi:hypothetical protein
VLETFFVGEQSLSERGEFSWSRNRPQPWSDQLEPSLTGSSTKAASQPLAIENNREDFSLRARNDRRWWGISARARLFAGSLLLGGPGAITGSEGDRAAIATGDGIITQGLRRAGL